MNDYRQAKVSTNTIQPETNARRSRSIGRDLARSLLNERLEITYMKQRKLSLSCFNI